MKKVLLLSLVAMFAGVAYADTLETVFFRADMTPANEVPAITGVNIAARAIISAHIRRNDAGAIVSGLVDFDVDYNFVDNEGTFSGLHIHDGAAGANGGVTINTRLASAAGIVAQNTGNIFRQANATSAAELATLNSMLTDPSRHYVNLHTTAHGGGAVRAQLSRADMRVSRVTLDPANEVPAVVSDARGTGNLTFLAQRDGNGTIIAGTVTFETTFNFSAPVTLSGWHIHTGAAGANGAVVINTLLATTSPESINATTGVVRRRVDVTSGAALTALQGIFANPANYYLNLHTTANGGGVMRGQLEDTVVNSYQVTMTTANEVPAVTGVDASAVANILVYSSRNAAGATNSATVIFDVTHAFPGATTFTGLHIHSGAAGANGGVVINTGIGGAAAVIDDDGVGNIYRAVDVSSLGAAALMAVQGMLANPSAYYVNLHTTSNAGGAVRGQVGAAPAPPAISRGGILNNASYNVAGTTVAPGTITAVFGSNMTNGSQCLSTQGCTPRFGAGVMSNNMGGTSATVNGAPAPVFYTTRGQIGIQIPVELSGTTANVVVTTEGTASAAESVTVEPATPGIFTQTGNGTGAGSITHANGALVTAANPASRGETLVLYGTGMGAMSPAVPTGTITSAAARLATLPIITVGGVPATVVFAGQSSCCVGLNQVNFTVPTSAPTGGAVAVVLSLGAKASNGVTLAIQ